MPVAAITGSKFRAEEYLFAPNFAPVEERKACRKENRKRRTAYHKKDSKGGEKAPKIERMPYISIRPGCSQQFILADMPRRPYAHKGSKEYKRPPLPGKRPLCGNNRKERHGIQEWEP